MYHKFDQPQQISLLVYTPPNMPLLATIDDILAHHVNKEDEARHALNLKEWQPMKVVHPSYQIADKRQQSWWYITKSVILMRI